MLLLSVLICTYLYDKPNFMETNKESFFSGAIAATSSENLVIVTITMWFVHAYGTKVSYRRGQKLPDAPKDPLTGGDASPAGGSTTVRSSYRGVRHYHTNDEEIDVTE